MGRLTLGICLLAVFLGLGLWINSFMDNTHVPISQALEEAAEKGLSGDLEAGADLAQKAKALWQDNWPKIASFSDHAPMDEIDSLFAQAETYARAGIAADFAALCARLSQLISAMSEAHSLFWWNLL